MAAQTTRLRIAQTVDALGSRLGEDGQRLKGYLGASQAMKVGVFQACGPMFLQMRPNGQSDS